MRRQIGLILLSLSLIAGAAAPGQPAFADSLTDAQKLQEQIQQALNIDKSLLATNRAKQAEVQAALDHLSFRITAAQAELAAENAKLDAIKGDLARTAQDLAAKRIEEAQKQELLNRRNRILYKQKGDSNSLDALFSARTFAELMDRFIAMRDIVHGDQLLLQQVQAARAAKEADQARLDQKNAEQTATVKEKRAKTIALNALFIQGSALQGLLASVGALLQADEAAKTAAYKAVTAEVVSLQAARSRAHSSGIFAWPGVQGPITQAFGCTDFQGEPPPPEGYSCPPRRPYFHAGIDIAGPYGSEIDSADGGIAYTYPGNAGYGNHVIVVHANGFVTLYGHMSSFAVSDAQGVAKGQRIGYEGSSGFSTGAHLHFEIRLNNQPVNPCQYVGC